MKSPKISVIMPNYNCWKYLGEAIESILNQSFSDLEFIIIDDWSTDDSWEIIQKYAKIDKRIKAYKNEQNMHIVYSRNRALQLAAWEYIAFLDSDDAAYPERLQIQLDFMELPENSKIGICGTNFDIINTTSQKIWEKKFPRTHQECIESIWYRNPFGQNTVLIRKKCFDKVWFYNNNYKNAEDLDMWIRMWKYFKLYNIQQNLSKYRVFWGNSIIKQQKTMIKSALKARKNALRLWYKIPLKWRFYYWGTWCMQFLPPRFVLWLFNKITKVW